MQDRKMGTGKTGHWKMQDRKTGHWKNGALENAGLENAGPVIRVTRKRFVTPPLKNVVGFCVNSADVGSEANS